jgi:hypothetical protein
VGQKILSIVAAAWGTVLLSGCSFQSTLDNMVSRERQAELVALGRGFCTDPSGLEKALHPGVRQSVKAAEAALPGECPSKDAKWELASYRWDTNVTDVKRQQEDAVIVGTSKGKWTSVSLRLYGENDAPKLIVRWHVVAGTKPPEALQFIEQYDATVRVLRFVAGGIVLAAAGLIYWFIRRRRAQRAA